MKIISLTASNIKRLVAVEIKPDGNLVEITGKNGAGKSSVLDALAWAIGGKDHIQSQPIRTGQDEAMVRLDLGTYIVTRRFRRKDGGEYTTSITVENPDGMRAQSPQALLDGFLGSLTFDPLAFTRMKPREQFDALRQFVPGVDFDAIDADNVADFNRRTEVNRKAKELRAQASGIIVPEAIPELVDEAALVSALEEAGTKNADIERERAERLRFALGLKAKAESIAVLDKSIADLHARIEQLGRELHEATMKRDGLHQAVLDGDNQRQALPELPEPIDTAGIRERIAAAKEHNRKVDLASRAKAELHRLQQEAIAQEQQSAKITERMAKRLEEKERAIAEAKMPVDGLSFGNGIVLLRGVPFEQGSDAERLTASIMIAAAMNPKLRVIRVHDGSLLDKNAMKLLAEFADKHDYQIWVETVQSGNPSAVLIEDGLVKVQPASEPEPQPELALG
jgi:dephospho-CoA kinase